MTIQTTGQRPHLNPRPGGVSRLALWDEAGEGGPAVDPITAEIVRSALVAITDEMKTNLMRTAYNMIIYESLDFTVGLFDAYGPAQQLYARRGYIPDGRGACQVHRPLRLGERVTVDHDLIIWLTKELKCG